MKTDNGMIDGKLSNDLFLEEINIIEYQILDGIDTLEPLDVAEDLCWTDHKLPYEEALWQATIMDREYLIIDEKHNIIGYNFYDKGRNVNEYFQLEYPELEYEDMKYDFDTMDNVEWECIMEEEMERYESFRTKILEFHVTDKDELIKLLQNEMNETIYRLKIHFNAGGRKFLIIISDMVQFYWYKVLIESESRKDNSLKYIGSDCNPEAVLYFINYFLETGQPLHII